jgi:uncharacterized protein (DUF849 family)
MTTANDQDLSRAAWRKSTFSGNGNNCVEAASANGHVHVRDTTDRTGVAKIFDKHAWQQFTTRIKQNKIRP